MGIPVCVECMMEKLLLARDSNRVITEINHVEHAWELHSHKHKATAHLHQYMHTHTDICKKQNPGCRRDSNDPGVTEKIILL